MTDKCTGPAAAAAEIACISVMRSKDVEAIILKYCPEDRMMEELLKVSRRLSEWLRGLAGECLKKDVRKLLEDFEAALTDYESDVKPTECSEDKAGKLVVDLLTDVESLMRVGVWNRREFSDLLKRVQAVLADHEKVKK